MKIEELREIGILLEVNRRVLHPIGFEAQADILGDIRIVRSVAAGDGGDRYPDGATSLSAKAAAFRAVEESERTARYRRRGYAVQPLPGEPAWTVAADSCECEGMWEAVEAMAVDLVRSLPLETEILDTVAAALMDALPHAVLAPMLGRLRLESENGGATWQWRIGPAPVPYEGGATLARCEYLIGEIHRLQFGGQAECDGASEGIRKYVERAKGELFPAEVAEFDAAKAAVDILSSYPASTGEDLPSLGGAIAGGIGQLHADLERLFALAQPGMRVYRGDPSALAAFETHRRKLRAAARGAVDRMSEYDRLASGELGDYEHADWAALESRLTEDLASATDRMGDAERDMNAATQSRDEAQRGLAVVGRALARER